MDVELPQFKPDYVADAVYRLTEAQEVLRQAIEDGRRNRHADALACASRIADLMRDVENSYRLHALATVGTDSCPNKGTLTHAISHGYKPGEWDR